jgi:hypothetical protein
MTTKISSKDQDPASSVINGLPDTDPSFKITDPRIHNTENMQSM